MLAKIKIILLGSRSLNYREYSTRTTELLISLYNAIAISLNNNNNIATPRDIFDVLLGRLNLVIVYRLENPNYSVPSKATFIRTNILKAKDFLFNLGLVLTNKILAKYSLYYTPRS